MRKLWVLLLICIFANFSIITVNAEQVEVSEERAFVEAVTNVNLDETVQELTREEFCKLIYNVTNSDTPEATNSVFGDVSFTSDYEGYIQRVYELGYISGDENGNFRPSDKINITEAYSVLLRMAGYGRFMSGEYSIGTINFDDYPEGVLTLAAQTGLSKGINKNKDALVDAETAYRIVYNLLFIDTYVVTYDKGIQKGDMYFEEILKLHEQRGVLEAVNGSSLHGELIDEKYVKFNNTLYINDAELAYEDIGLAGKFYYRDGDDYNEVVAFVPKNNTIIKIFSEDIRSYSNNKYEYFENDKKKDAKLVSSKDVLYNHTQAVDESVMIPRYGYVTLIDNDGDKKNDVVIVEDYRNIYPSYIDTINNSILYYDSSLGYAEKKELLIGERECEVTDEQGRDLPLSAVKANSVVTIMENADKVYIYQSSGSVKGKINFVDTDEITINEEEYILSKDVYKGSWDGASLIEVEAFYDMLGNIGAVLPLESQWQYGYVIKTKYNSDEDAYALRLLLSNNTKEWVLLNGEKVRYNGANVIQEGEITNLVNFGLIRYKTNNEGRIRAIDTATNLSSFDLKNTNLSEYDSLLKRHHASTRYKSAARLFRLQSWNGNVLRGEAYLDTDTLLFIVPESVTSTTTEDEYLITNSLKDNFTRVTASYNTVPSSLTADVVVCFSANPGAEMRSTTEPMVIEKIKSVEYDGEITYEVTGLYAGSEVKKYLDETEISKFADAKPGDYFQVNIEDEYIVNSRKIYTLETGKLNSGQYYYAGSSGGTDEGEYRYLAGNVIAIEDDKMLFKYATPSGDHMEIFRTGDFQVYVYDANMPSGKYLYLGDVDEVKEDDTVIISTVTSLGRVMYVIKN